MAILEVVEQDRGQVAINPLTHQDPLHGDIRGRAGQGIGGHLPAAVTQTVGQVEERVSGVFALSDAPCDSGDALGRITATEQLEGAELGDLLGQVPSSLVAGVVDGGIARRGPAG